MPASGRAAGCRCVRRRRLEHARPPRRAGRRARPAHAPAPRPRLDHPDRGRPAGRRSGRPRAPPPARAGQGAHHRPLGADGRSAAAPAAHLPERLPARGDRAAGEGHRPALLLQPPLQRDRGDRGLRPAPPRHGRGDPLHVGGLGASARRARGRAARAGAAGRVRGRPRGDDRRARRGARDRAALRRQAGQLPPPRGPARLRSTAARPLLPGGDPGRRPARARRGQDPRPLRRRGHHHRRSTRAPPTPRASPPPRACSRSSTAA